MWWMGILCSLAMMACGEDSPTGVEEGHDPLGDAGHIYIIAHRPAPALSGHLVPSIDFVHWTFTPTGPGEGRWRFVVETFVAKGAQLLWPNDQSRFWTTGKYWVIACLHERVCQYLLERQDGMVFDLRVRDFLPQDVTVWATTVLIGDMGVDIADTDYRMVSKEEFEQRREEVRQHALAHGGP